MLRQCDGLFPLPSLFDDQTTPVCWSYGMGVESTAGVVRTLLDPGFRPPELREDLSNLIVMVAQTGDEWTSTCDLVTAQVLPLLRERAIRFVEVARAGPSEADGIVILQDTPSPMRLHPDADEHGFYALSTEHRANGVLPTLGGSRTCSAKSKGMPLDLWRARHLGHEPYVHVVGFNADLCRRIVMCPSSIASPVGLRAERLANDDRLRPLWSLAPWRHWGFPRGSRRSRAGRRCQSTELALLDGNDGVIEDSEPSVGPLIGLCRTSARGA